MKEKIIKFNKTTLNGITQKRLTGSEKRAKRKYPDYDLVLKHTSKIAKIDTSILDEIFSAADPAETAYLIGKLDIVKKEYEAKKKMLENITKKPVIANRL
jgi:hypothetical protein